MNRIDLTKPKSDFKRYIPQVQDTYHPVFLFEFAGPIGAGKSETCRELFNLFEEMKIPYTGFRFNHLEEDIYSESTKKAIDDFYSGKSDSPSELEKTICSNRLQMLINKLLYHKQADDGPRIVLSDRAFEEDIVFIDNLLANETRENEIERLNNIKSNIKEFARGLDEFDSAVIHYVIYLDPGLSEALRRIKKRGRPNEQQLNFISLGRLTSDPLRTFAGTVLPFGNKDISARETATLLANIILDEINSYGTYAELPSPKVLLSAYGVPGSGKTSLIRKLHSNLIGFSHEFEVFLDDSDSDEIVEKQKLVYEESTKCLTPEEMQKYIDKRRIEGFRRLLKGSNSLLLMLTDIGPQTSNIFRSTNGLKLDTEYLMELEGNHDVFVNAIIFPDLESTSWYRCRKAIKERGRPGECEWFTEERLERINVAIRQMVQTDERKNVFNVELDNIYTEESLEEMFRQTMEGLRNALIRYATSR